MLVFGMVSVLRSRANWILISSNCLIRIHSCLSILADLSAVGADWREVVASGLVLPSVAGPV